MKNFLKDFLQVRWTMNRLNRSTETVWQQYVVEGQVKIFAKKFEIFSHRFMKFSNFFNFFCVWRNVLTLFELEKMEDFEGSIHKSHTKKGFNHKHKGFMRWNGIFWDQNGIKVSFLSHFHLINRRKKWWRYGNQPDFNRFFGHHSGFLPSFIKISQNM